MRGSIGAALLVGTLCGAPLHAEAGGPPRRWELGVGAATVFQGNFIDEPGDKQITLDDGTQAELVYPGFAGFSAGGGFTFNGMYKGAIGLELGLIYSRDSATGQIDRVDVTIGQWAVHIPILVKASIPFRAARPFLLVGPELVIPAGAEAETARKLLTEVDAKASFYVALAAGIGVEFLLPIEDVDLRIPFSLRYLYNPGVAEKAADRLDDFEVHKVPGGYVIDSLTFKSEMQHQAQVTLGVAYYFR